MPNEPAFSQLASVVRRLRRKREQRWRLFLYAAMSQQGREA
jgi:hypothetical protein